MPRKGPPDPFPGKPPVDPFNPAPPGQAPIAADDQFSTKQALSLSGNLLANNGAGEDTDPNDDPLTVTEVDGEVISETPISVTSDYGRTAQLLVQDTGALTLNPSTDFNELAVGEDDTITLSYKVSDGRFWDTADVTVTIQGLNDPIQIGTADLSGEVTEDEATPYLTDSGTIEFSDVDWSDVHEVSATLKGTTHSSQLGTLTAEVTADTTEGAGGLVNWNFSVDNNAVQFLEAGESISEAYTVTLTDNQGSTVTRDVAVTINGVDDLDIDVFVGLHSYDNQVFDNQEGTLVPGDDMSGGGFRTHDVALADFDGDGYLDILSANGGGEPSRLMLYNPQDQTYDLASSFANQPTIAAGDLDGDGDVDAMAVDIYRSHVDVYYNDGGGHLAHNTVYTGIGAAPKDIALGDLDADGDLDAILANEWGNNLVLENPGNGAFQARVEGSGGGEASRAIALGDLDGDNDLDAIVANQGFNQILINQGNGYFSASYELTGQDKNSYGVAIGDLDGDNDFDAFIVNQGDYNQVLENLGGGNFVAHDVIEGDINNSYGVAMGDLDRDGDLDVVVSTDSGDQFLENRGDATFFEAVDITSESRGHTDLNSFEVALGDLDGDGSDPVDENGLPNINQDGLLPSIYVDMIA